MQLKNKLKQTNKQWSLEHCVCITSPSSISNLTGYLLTLKIPSIMLFILVLLWLCIQMYVFYTKFIMFCRHRFLKLMAGVLIS